MSKNIFEHLWLIALLKIHVFPEWNDCYSGPSLSLVCLCFEVCVRWFLSSVCAWLDIPLPNSLPTPLTTQVTGQAWQYARESKGSGVRGIGQGWMWGRATHRVWAWDCRGLQISLQWSTELKPHVKSDKPQPSVCVMSRPWEDSWDGEERLCFTAND